MESTSAHSSGSGNRLSFWQLILVILCLPAAAVAVWNAVTEASSNDLDQHLSGHIAPTVPAAPPATEAHDQPEKHEWAFVPATLSLANSRQPVLLYASPTTAQYFKSVGGNYELLLAPWRNFLMREKLPFAEVDSLAAISENADAVLLLPSAVALSNAERQQIGALRQRGGNILATWSAGVRDEHGKWTGHAWMEELFGIRVAGELEPGNDSRFLNLSGNSPLSAGYPAGVRIWLEDTAEPALRLSGGSSAAFYLDWIRSASAGPAEAAVVYGEQNADQRHARWAIFGFPESSWGRQAEQLSNLFKNTLHWLSRGTLVNKATWPFPYLAAYIIEMDTEESFGNAYHLAEMMDDIAARATFYCLTSEAIRFPNLVRHLAKRHEIAYHGDIHVGFNGQSETTQAQRLQRMKAQMRTLLADTSIAVGFRAPLEEYDKTTEHLLNAHGFRHHAADPNRTDARLPFFLNTGEAAPDKALVIIPRTQHDDISLLASLSSSAAEQSLLRALVGDFDNAMHSGAMGLLSIHSQRFARGSTLHLVMPQFLRHAAAYRHKVWIAGANEVAEWWRERERLHYKVNGNSDTFRLDVRIDGSHALSHGAIVITNQSAGGLIDVKAEKSGQPVPRIMALDAFRTALVFDGMAGGTYSYQVSITSALASGADRQKRPAL